MTEKSYAGNKLQESYQICPGWLLSLLKKYGSSLSCMCSASAKGIAYTFLQQVRVSYLNSATVNCQINSTNYQSFIWAFSIFNSANHS